MLFKRLLYWLPPLERHFQISVPSIIIQLSRSAHVISGWAVRPFGLPAGCWALSVFVYIISICLTELSGQIDAHVNSTTTVVRDNVTILPCTLLWPRFTRILITENIPAKLSVYVINGQHRGRIHGGSCRANNEKC